MIVSRLLSFECLILFRACLSLAIIQDQRPIASRLELRNASIADAEAVTNIILTAFHDSAHFKYQYQFMDEHPREHHDCFYLAVREVLDLPAALTQVALMPNLTSPHNMTPVAVAIWALPLDIGPPAKSFLSPLDALIGAGCQHRDLNITRAIDFDVQFRIAKRKYLDEVYPVASQFYLAALGTLPDYQGQGAGGALVRSGLALGKRAYSEANVTATLIATTAGEPLYAHLRWDSLKNFTVKSLDETNGEREKWRFDVMKHDL